MAMLQMGLTSQVLLSASICEKGLDPTTPLYHVYLLLYLKYGFTLKILIYLFGCAGS